MRWRDGLGSSLLRECSRTPCYPFVLLPLVGFNLLLSFLLCYLSLRSCRFGLHSVLLFLVVAGLRSGCYGCCRVPRWDVVSLFFDAALQEFPIAFLSGSTLTLPRTASGHTAAFQIQQSPNMAAMRWRGWLGQRLTTGLSRSSYSFETFELDTGEGERLAAVFIT